jgi:hypothetical protein
LIKQPLLIAAINPDFNIRMRPRHLAQEQIDRPPARDKPRPGKVLRELRHLFNRAE